MKAIWSIRKKVGTASCERWLTRCFHRYISVWKRDSKETQQLFSCAWRMVTRKRKQTESLLLQKAELRWVDRVTGRQTSAPYEEGTHVCNCQSYKLLAAKWSTKYPITRGVWDAGGTRYPAKPLPTLRLGHLHWAFWHWRTRWLGILVLHRLLSRPVPCLSWITQSVWHSKELGSVALLGQLWRSEGFNYQDTQGREKKWGAAARTKVRNDRKAWPGQQGWKRAPSKYSA